MQEEKKVLRFAILIIGFSGEKRGNLEIEIRRNIKP